MKKIEQQELSLFYEKAKNAFQECISDPENKFLEDQIDIPLDSIVLKKEFVRVTYYGVNDQEYVIEIKFLLFSEFGKEFGYYSLLEDENSIVIDDFLVFN